MPESYDYIVVGAGSSGCALAHRLSEHATVLLLEAGGPDSSPAIHDPAAIVQAIFGDPQISVPYVTEPQEHLKYPGEQGSGRPMAIHRGVVRGGCSAVNGMLYVRGNRADYDHWAALGNEGWAYDDVLPYFLRSEDSTRGLSDHHGVGGPLHVRAMPDPSPVSRAFVEAAAALERFSGSGSGEDFNGAHQSDVAAIYDVNVTAEGGRASAAVAFLDPIRDRESLTVMTGKRVTRVVTDGGRAIGVDAVDEDGVSTRYRAEAEVVLSAGAFESPKLLMLSGIGPAAHLRKHGISVVQDLPGVGENLQDHLMVLLYCLAEPGSRPGISTFLAEAGLFTDSGGRADAPPDLQFHFLAGMQGFPVDPVAEPNFLFGPTLLQPESRGTVRLTSADPAVPPSIAANYLENAADVEVLVRGIELSRELSNTSPLLDFAGDAPLFGVVLDPVDPFTKPPTRLEIPAQGRAGLDDFVRTTATTVWHPVGTCKMGQDDMSVIDPHLRVRGIDGLRVADASIMPRITSGNTHAPCVMIGEKAADLMSK